MPPRVTRGLTQRCLDMQGDRAGRAKQALSRTVLQASDLEISFELRRPLAARVPSHRAQGNEGRIALTRRLVHSPPLLEVQLLHKAHEAIAGSGRSSRRARLGRPTRRGSPNRVSVNSRGQRVRP